MEINWSYNEDFACCEEYVKKYLINKDYDDSNILAYNLNLKFKNKIEAISISRKLSNIKHLLLQMNINHNNNIKPLNHFSEQNLVALCKVLKKYNIPFDIDLEKLKKLLESRK